MSEQTCIRSKADTKQINRCREEITQNNGSFEFLSQIFSLAGSEVRLKMLFLLHNEGELCPCDIADILHMTVPAVSQQLRKLKDRNIILTRRAGQTIYYSINADHLHILAPLLNQLQDLFNKKVKI